MTLLQMSFSGAILIFAIIILRILTLHYLPKKIFLYLWEITILRLLLPFSISSIFSIYSLISYNKELKSTLTPLIPMTSTYHLTSNINTSNNNLNISLLNIIWFIGFIILITFFLGLYLFSTKNFKDATPINDSYINQWLKNHQTKRSLSIKQYDKISSPLTYGFFHSTILMPKETDWGNHKQIDYVLLHEYMHICHYDIIIKFICIFTLCIHWFNPMVWIMFILFNRDIELVCDERVIHCLGINSKKKYATILIHMEEQKNIITPFFTHFSKSAIEERIIAIMKTRKKTKKILFISLFIFIIITIPLTTSAKETNMNSSALTTNENITIDEVIERITSNYGLEKAVHYENKINDISQDRIILLCQSQDGKYQAYGFISPEYGKYGILINTIIDNDDNWNYIKETWDYGQIKPSLEVINDYEVQFTFNRTINDICHVTFETYDTGTISY